MTDAAIQSLGMIGTWFNALAMAAAALFAALAWRAQVRYARSGEQRSDRAAAVRSLDGAITDLTTGPVADARKVVTDWATHFQGNPTSHRRTNEPIRGDALVGRYANTDVRHHVFVLLWALQRLAPLAEDVHLARDSQRAVLVSHLNLMTSALSDLTHILEVDECRIFADSASAATDSVLGVADALGLSMEDRISLSVNLSGFSLQITEDDPAE